MNTQIPGIAWNSFKIQGDIVARMRQPEVSLFWVIRYHKSKPLSTSPLNHWLDPNPIFWLVNVKRQTFLVTETVFFCQCCWFWISISWKKSGSGEWQKGKGIKRSPLYYRAFSSPISASLHIRTHNNNPPSWWSQPHNRTFQIRFFFLFHFFERFVFSFVREVNEWIDGESANLVI